MNDAGGNQYKFWSFKLRLHQLSMSRWLSLKHTTALLTIRLRDYKYEMTHI